MKRILIIGSAGAGKSTLARRLHRVLGLPVIHLDTHYWRPGWVETPKEEWKDRVETLISQDEWIMDGNYGGTLDARLEACDAVFYLNFSRYLCLYRVFKRSLSTWGRTRSDMNPGCREQLPDREFLKWIWTYPSRRRPAVLAKLSEAESEGKRVFVTSSPKELERVMRKLEVLP